MATRSLDALVSEVASRLMSIDSSSNAAASEGVLELLVDHLGVDTSFLRYNDHTIHATVLVAEWPVRVNVPTPDPLGVVYFSGADSIFAAAEKFSEPIIIRPEESTSDYQDTVRSGSGVSSTSLATVPLLSGATTTGALGFVKFGDRAWDEAEVNALTAIAALLAQVQARIEADEKLRFNASHDDLTGLSNRRALLEYMAHRLSAGSADPVAVMFLDLDRLKSLNDFLGHAAGDLFIHTLARRLRDQTDPRDMIARLGGDEFVMIPAVAMNESGAEKEARRVQSLVTERVRLGGEFVSRGVSVGVAIGMPGQSSVSDVLRHADQALLVAKAEGGNGIAVFTEEMRAEYELRDDIELKLRNAVDDGSLLLHYQPEIDMLTGKIMAIEALVRWQHPSRGLLQPGAFIEVAEATNLAGVLGRWVITQACETVAEWRNAGVGTDVVLRINVSPVQLVSLDFVDSVADVLRKCGLSGEAICLEITEHVVVHDLSRTKITLRGLKKLGVQVAIDDFGTGYSSLSHLKSLRVDALKIDRGFVRNLGANDNDLAIVKSIVGLANSFGLSLVAEGVETELAATTLLSLGCTRAQGFLFSRPVSGVRARRLLENGFLPVRNRSTPKQENKSERV